MEKLSKVTVWYETNLTENVTTEMKMTQKAQRRIYGENVRQLY